MKKFLLVLWAWACLLGSACAFQTEFATSLDTFAIRLETERFDGQFGLKRKNGLFQLNKFGALRIIPGDGWRLGDFSPTGAALMMLFPPSGSLKEVFGGSHLGKGSLFSGLAFKKKNLSVFCSNPVFSRDSPSAFGIIASDRKRAFGFAHSYAKSSSSSLVTDWKTRFPATGLWSFLGAFRTEKKMLNLALSMEAAWSAKTGLSRALGWNLAFEWKKIKTSLEFNFAEGFPSVLYPEGKDSPRRRIRWAFETLSGGTKASFFLDFKKYKPPLHYSNIQKLELDVRTEMEIPAGEALVLLKSGFSFVLKETRKTVRNEEARLQIKMDKCSFALGLKNLKPKLELELRKARISLWNGKFSCVLNINKKLGSADLNIKLHENGKYEISLRFES